MASSSSSSFWTLASRQAMKSGLFIAKFYCFLHVTTNYLGFMAYAYGPSMIPTLHPSGNILLAERISKRYQKPDRGDIVVIRSPENPNRTPIKRVVGIEGDCISFVVDPAKSHKSQTIVVPKGHVFVQGDYTHNSRDSRSFGPVPYGLIQGRVLWRGTLMRLHVTTSVTWVQMVRRRDADERPELCRGTVDFVATKEYMVRDPMPAVYFFLIDGSMNAIQTGATAAACSPIQQYVLQKYDNQLSKKFNDVVNEIRRQRSSYQRLKLCKKGDAAGNMLFQSYMVEDMGSGGPSYVDFLVSVHRQIQHKLN